MIHLLKEISHGHWAFTRGLFEGGDGDGRITRKPATGNALLGGIPVAGFYFYSAIGYAPFIHCHCQLWA
ncbi:hypothetical protein H5T87_09120 [bacterium]|nr:hypothetical protein [bacterium]